MSKWNEWMTEHEEVTGVLLTLLVVAVLAFSGYVVSSVVSAGKSQSPSGVASETKATEGESGAEETSSPVESQEPQTEAPTKAPETVPSAAETHAAGSTLNEFGVVFTMIEAEPVTAVSETNLRNTPSTASDDYIVVKIYDGDVVTRNGKSENGWSRIEYNGQTLYAATNLLKAAEGTSHGRDEAGE